MADQLLAAVRVPPQGLAARVALTRLSNSQPEYPPHLRRRFSKIFGGQLFHLFHPLRIFIPMNRVGRYCDAHSSFPESLSVAAELLGSKCQRAFGIFVFRKKNITSNGSLLFACRRS